MFDRRFFASKLGLAATASVTAMMALNVYAMSIQPTTMPALLPQSGISDTGISVITTARLA